MTPLSVRGWAEPPDGWKLNPGPTSRSAKPQHRYGVDEALIFDTETTADLSQRLMVLGWRLVVDGDVIEEGLAHPDDAGPAVVDLLRSYAASHPGATVAGTPMVVVPLSEWLDTRLHRYGVKRKADVVGFNLPFDLSRLAKHATVVRRASRFKGGWSLGLWGEPDRDDPTKWHDMRYRHRLLIRNLGARRGAFMGWRGEAHNRKGEGSESFHAGHFVDLGSLTYALTGRHYSLASACPAFGVEREPDAPTWGRLDASMLDHVRADVAATAALYLACQTELAAHPGVELAADRLYSPAGLASAYLTAMGITPPRRQHPDFDRELLGAAAVASYAGRAEARIIRTPVPVTVLDWSSMYPSVCALAGLWRHWCAKRLAPTEVTDELRAWLADAPESLVERCLDPASWRRWGITLVEVEPAGDVLVHRSAPDGHTWGTATNPLHYDGRLWWSWADVAAAAVIGNGLVPKITRAVRLDPQGRQAGLKPVALREGTVLDPRRDDPFVALVAARRSAQAKGDERTALALKVMVNSLAHGLSSRIDDLGPSADPVAMSVWAGAGRPFGAKVHRVERPGPWSFPPISATACAGARLALALVEAMVTDAGGTWAFMDSDSIAIVATPDGGPVPCPGGEHSPPSPQRPTGAPSTGSKAGGGPLAPDNLSGTVQALSWGQVEAIRERFRPLNPFDDASPPWGPMANSLTEPTMAFVVGIKRYVLYRPSGAGKSGVEIVEGTEHGLPRSDRAGRPGAEREPRLGRGSVALRAGSDRGPARVVLPPGRPVRDGQHPDRAQPLRRAGRGRSGAVRLRLRRSRGRRGRGGEEQ